MALARKIIIIGGGLGGLTAAYCFAKHNFKVELLERRPESSFLGGIMLIQGNASRFLAQWGLKPQLEAISDISTGFRLYDAISGNLVYTRERELSRGEPSVWSTDRRTVQKILYEAVQNQGANVRFNALVTDINEDGTGATALLASGETIHGDVILVADGITSRLRPQVLQALWRPEYVPQAEGTANHQIEISEQEVLEDKVTRHLVQEVNLAGWTRPKGKIVLRFNTKRRTLNGLFCISDPEELEFKTRLWDKKGDIEYVRDSFKDCHESIRAVLRKVKSCDCWREAQLPDLPTWRSEQGRLLLLGDATHGMYPDAAQGYSQIVEDIAVIHFLLDHASVPDVATAASYWEQIRKPRAERIKALSYANHLAWVQKGTKLANMPRNPQTDGKLQAGDGATPDINADFNSPAFTEWMTKTDAVQEAVAFLERVHAPSKHVLG